MQQFPMGIVPGMSLQGAPGMVVPSGQPIGPWHPGYVQVYFTII